MVFFIFRFYMFQNVLIGNDYCGEFDFNNFINILLLVGFFNVIKLNIKVFFLIVIVIYKGDIVVLIGI